MKVLFSLKYVILKCNELVLQDKNATFSRKVMCQLHVSLIKS